MISCRTLFTGLLIFSAVVVARAGAPVDAAPRATALMVDYKGELRPVMGVKNDRAFVVVNGKQEVLPAKVNFLPMRAQQGHPGYVEFSSERSGGARTERVWHFSNGGEASGGIIDQYSDYEALLTSQTKLEDCYLAVLFFNTAYLHGDEGTLRCQVVFHAVGTLEAGKPKKVKTQFSYLENKEQRLSYCTLLFSRGFEVRTSESGAGNQFLRKIESAMHSKLVEAYVAKKKEGSFPLKPYVQSQFMMPAEVDVSTIPSEVKVCFTVTDQGLVEGVQINGELPSLLRTALRENLESWLFYPRISNGSPATTAVLMPIGLK